MCVRVDRLRLRVGHIFLVFTCNNFLLLVLAARTHARTHAHSTNIVHACRTPLNYTKIVSLEAAETSGHHRRVRRHATDHRIAYTYFCVCPPNNLRS